MLLLPVRFFLCHCLGEIVLRFMLLLPVRFFLCHCLGEGVLLFIRLFPYFLRRCGGKTVLCFMRFFPQLRLLPGGFIRQLFAILIRDVGHVQAAYAAFLGGQEVDARVLEVVTKQVHIAFKTAGIELRMAVLTELLTKIGVGAVVPSDLSDIGDQPQQVFGKGFLLLVRPAVGLYTPDTVLTAQLQLQLSVVDISAGAGERRLAGGALLLFQDHQRVSRTGDTVGSGYLVDVVAVGLLARVMHEQDADLHFVGDLL